MSTKNETLLIFFRESHQTKKGGHNVRLPNTSHVYIIIL
nr:MAG TPA: hypothetical protein [Caudoviricetes sp.]